VTHNLKKIKELILERNPTLGGFTIDINDRFTHVEVKYRTLYWTDYDLDEISKIVSEFRYMGLDMCSHYEEGKLVFMTFVPHKDKLVIETAH
jgi:hypothetical protein